MKKTTFLLIFFVSTALFSQETKPKKVNNFLEASFQTSLNARLSGDLTYRLNAKKFTFSAHYSYGLMGQKSIKNADFRDAYGFIPSGVIEYAPNYRFDYFHRFVGHDIGIGFGGSIFIGEKHTLALSAKLGAYIVSGHFKYTNVSDPTNAFFNGEGDISTVHANIGFEALYFYQINEIIALKIGAEMQFIGGGQHKQIGTLYAPVNFNYPLYGLKPNFTIGVQFNLKKKL